MEKVERPWGSYEVLLDTPNYKVKRITVNPGGQLSEQYHFKRDETWTIVEGEAQVQLTIDGVVNDWKFLPGQTCYIHRLQSHRVKNEKETPLVFIETQTGDYFGEDDIVRTKDNYGRA